MKGNGKTFRLEQEYVRVDGTPVAQLTGVGGMQDLHTRRLVADRRSGVPFPCLVARAPRSRVTRGRARQPTGPALGGSPVAYGHGAEREVALSHRGRTQRRRVRAVVLT